MSRLTFSQLPKSVQQKLGSNRTHAEVKSKYHSKRTVCDGYTFDSKKEAKRYQDLKVLQQAGEVNFFLCQVPLRLGAGIKYVIDFVVFWADGKITWEDVKGHKTPVYKMKKKLVESKYPIKILEI